MENQQVTVLDPLEHGYLEEKYKNRKKIITKHDEKVCGKKNTTNLEYYCDDLDNLGDLSYYKIKLSSNVKNSLHKSLRKYYN